MEDIPCSWVANGLDPRQIVADDLVRWREEEGKDKTSNHQHEKGDVSSIVDIGQCGVPVLSDWDGRADYSAEVENCPEDANVSAFLLLGRIRHHNSTLSGPEETRTDTKNRACCNNEVAVLVVIV